LAQLQVTPCLGYNGHRDVSDR